MGLKCGLSESATYCARRCTGLEIQHLHEKVMGFAAKLPPAWRRATLEEGGLPAKARPGERHLQSKILQFDLAD